MNISIEIKAPELANAIYTLAKALEGSKAIQGADFSSANDFTAVKGQPQQVPAQQQTAQSLPTAVPTAQPAPVQQPPVQQASAQQPEPQAVPTSAPTYTMEQLAVAATQLMDAGKRDQLLQLLASFGVQALTALPQEQYGAFATKLRELGAKI
ncbi:hypothetical protein [Heyndrickxia sporothermodurans]|uniref:hypothetical protein n=1 Tax=Heyndrickxia sporothermodurans TaxID=46224 RepID=UPI0035D7EF55